jgi:hypothetical protein
VNQHVKVDAVVFILENAYPKRICEILHRNVADKTLFEYLNRVVVECFSP